MLDIRVFLVFDYKVSVFFFVFLHGPIDNYHGANE